MEKRKLKSRLILYFFSAILVICQVIIFLFPPNLPPGLELPLFFKYLPLLALAMLWLKRLLFHQKPGASVLKAIFWIFIVFFTLGALLETEFSMFSLVDREKREVTVTIGKADSSKSGAFIFHPGGTDLLRTVNRAVAEKLAQNGYLITLSTAHAGLKIHPQPGTLLGLASPVYFGSIRPPLMDFIQRTDLTGVKCFVILTGSVDTADEVENLKKIIESKGAIFVGGRKFISTTPPQDLEIESFVDDILKEIGF